MKRRSQSPQEWGWVVKASPSRDPYGIGEYIARDGEGFNGLTADLQIARFFQDEGEANAVGHWQLGFTVQACRQDGRIRTLGEPDSVAILPRTESAPTLGFRLR